MNHTTSRMLQGRRTRRAPERRIDATELGEMSTDLVNTKANVLISRHAVAAITQEHIYCHTPRTLSSNHHLPGVLQRGRRTDNALRIEGQASDFAGLTATYSVASVA